MVHLDRRLSTPAPRRGITAAVVAVGILVALVAITGRAEGQTGSITGEIPAAGSFGLVTWTGGSLDQLEADAAAVGCRAAAAWVTEDGEFIGHLFGAPPFVNAAFAARFPQGLEARPLLLVCDVASGGAIPPPPTATPTPPAPGASRFETLPVGSALPSGATCAALVRPSPELRSGNATYNATRGTSPHDTMPRVDGDFTGTTDELIQWAACKWGIDEDVARAQVAIESWWHQTTGGDLTTDQSACHPDLRTGSGQCPESIGLMQVRFLYHGDAFEDANAIRSSAYNLDYSFAVWRSCYEGELTWLNTVERGAEYVAGDLWGCTGVWFSGRWYVPRAIEYIGRVQGYLNDRVWEAPDFRG